MFSRSFIKSSEQTAEDVTRRAEVSETTVRRSPACSGEHNYSYAHPGFRIFRSYHAPLRDQDRDQDAVCNHSENLVADFHQVYQNSLITLPYHYALTAIHHASSFNSVNRFLGQIRITERLLTSTAATIPPTIPATIPEPEPIHLAEARRQLAAYKTPKRVIFVDELPRNAMGKVQKNLLRERYADLFRT